MEIYHTIYKGGNGEIVEKKSRFIAEVHPVTSEEEAMEILEQIESSTGMRDIIAGLTL